MRPRGTGVRLTRDTSCDPKWLKFAQSSGHYFLVGQPASHDTVPTLYLLQYQVLQYQARYLIRFRLRRLGFGTHRCYRHLNEPFPNALVHRAPFRVRYMPWFVLLISGDTCVVLREH